MKNKENTSILMYEYAALRAEITARVSAAWQIVGFSFLSLIFIAQIADKPRTLVTMIVILALGVAACFYYNARDINKLARRLREIEEEVDEATGEWYLLRWERLWGPPVNGYWQPRPTTLPVPAKPEHIEKANA